MRMAARYFASGKAQATGVRAAEKCPRLGIELHFPHVVEEPGRHELHVALGAFLLEEALELVVAVALGGHGPELADDGHARPHQRAVHFHFGEHSLAAPECAEDVALGLEGVLHDGAAFGDGRVGGALLNFVRPNAVAEGVEHVARHDPLHDGDEELGREVDAGLLAGGLREAALLLEEHDAEAVEAGVAQGLAVLGHVHAEAARTAGPGGDEHVAVDDLSGRHALVVAQVGQELHQVAHGEIGRVALAAVAELLAGAEGIFIRAVEGEHVVPEAAEGALDEGVLELREAAEEDRDLPALALLHSGVRHGFDPVVLLRDAQTCALGVLKVAELRVDGGTLRGSAIEPARIGKGEGLLGRVLGECSCMGSGWWGWRRDHSAADGARFRGRCARRLRSCFFPRPMRFFGSSGSETVVLYARMRLAGQRVISTARAGSERFMARPSSWRCLSSSSSRRFSSMDTLEFATLAFGHSSRRSSWRRSECA